MSNYFKTLECGHCGNIAPMQVVAEHTERVVLGSSQHTQENYANWRILVCPACRRPILYETTWDNLDVTDTKNIYTYRTLYPESTIATDDLPERVRQSYESALRVRNIEPNAFAVLLGRTLEYICEDKEAKGKSLFDKLDDLSSRQEIPGRLAEMAHKLRSLRNIGAHADKGEISSDDVPLLIDFTESILDYIYRAPAKLEAVQKRIERRDENI